MLQVRIRPTERRHIGTEVRFIGVASGDVTMANVLAVAGGGYNERVVIGRDGNDSERNPAGRFSRHRR